MNDKLAILEQVPGLRGTDREALRVLAGQLRHRTYKDELLCREGDEGNRLWVLASGTAEVLKRSESGRDFVVATMTPICLIGQVGLFTASGRTASIRARGAVDVLQMSSTQAHLLLRTAEASVASPLRRALIIALSQQLMVATQTLCRLADEVGVTDALPPDEAERLLLEAESKL